MTHWLIVGGGTAGCVLAARLSEDRAQHVTLIEAGPERAGSSGLSYLDDLEVDGAVWPALFAADGGETRRPYPQGRGLGGSSSINGAVLSGGALPQYAEWGWTGLVAARARLRLPTATVSIARLGPVDRALLGSARDGQRVTLSRAGERRVSASDAYLNPARDRPNLVVLPDTLVERVLVSGRTAVGVITAAGDRIAADRVVCSAGAIHTPALLQRSGVTIDGVGDGLADHPSRRIEIALKPGATRDPGSIVTGAVMRRGRIELVALNHLGRHRPGTAALLVGLLRTSRRGTVRLDPDRGEDPAVPPIVDFGRMDDPDDVRWLADGVELARRLLMAPSFDSIIDGFDDRPGDGGYAHASSSCRVGAVVDQWSTVVGYPGLHVCDASVFPEIPASGTYLPTVLLAERLAARWLR